MYNQYHSTPPPPPPPSSGIHGGLLEVTVVGCTKLKDTEWISRQDPYVCVEYGSTKFRTRTCTDGHKNPTFQEKFNLKLIEGIREINVQVWNSNTLSTDDFIGSGKIQLQKVLSQGFDDNSWTLHSKSGRYAGEVKLIMHFANSHSQKPTAASAPPPPPPQPQYYNYSAPPPPYPTHIPPQVPTNYNSYPPVSSSSSSSAYNYNNPPNYPYNHSPPVVTQQPYYYSSSSAPAATAYPPPPPPTASPIYPPPSIYPPPPPRPYY
ncbi:toll-interacting protein-like [Impatiens glandulifera]|uniref:toll-interacting protein-like n=1 Tax=Impatiens glandulifera TaxID=253017 RepID=UPI001FB198F8|nr:toll-interacting protein-like [Impatiens glandulifera]